MTPTWLYTIVNGASVRVPWQDVARTQYGAKIDWQHAEPYYEPPLRAQMPTAEQRQIESMVSKRMRNTDNANAGLTRNGKPQGQSRKDKIK